MLDKDNYIKLLEEQLRIQAEIIDLLPVNIYWKDKGCTLRGCNQRNAKQFGLRSPKEIIGLSQRDLVSKKLPPDEQETEIRDVETSDRKVMESNQPLTFEEIHHLPEGSIHYLSTKAPLHDAKSKVTGLVGISIDITQQKLAEQRERQALAEAAEARALAKAEAELRQSVMVLAGSIAHDLRTPLLIVRTLAEVTGLAMPKLLAAYSAVEAANTEDFEKIRSIHLKKLPEIPQDLTKLVSEMNDYINVSLKSLAQVLAKDIKPEDLVDCSADYCIVNTIGRYPFIEDERQLVHIDTTYQFTFKGNQVLVFRILSNLIKNALEQIRKNQKGEIFITTRDGGELNEIVVKDTAGGTSPEIAASLFGGYKTTKEGGTGVGLAFCKLTMDSFQGKISCHTVQGDYIEFILGFPKL